MILTAFYIRKLARSISLKETDTMTKDFINKVILNYAEKKELNIQLSQYEEKDFYIIEGWESQKIIDLLDNLNIAYGFSDEYTTCNDCSNVIRTSPDCYQWQADFYLGDGFICCNECFNDNNEVQENYIEELVNNPKKANQLLSKEQLTNLGYTKLNKDQYQSGLHTSMDDSPQDIFDSLKNTYDNIIFMIDNVSQFYIEFDVYVLL